MGMHLIGVHLTGVRLTGVHLTGVYLTGVHLMGVYLMSAYLMGVYHGMQPVLLSRTYVFAAFDGRWPGIAFLILALSGNFGGFSLGPSVG